MLPWTYNATYAVPEPPRTIEVDRVLVFELLLTNTGSSPWPLPSKDLSINVSYHWRDGAGNDLVFEGQRTQLKTSVESGAQTKIILRVLPPPTAGEAVLVIDLVKEGESWFSWKGVAPLELPVTVLPSRQLPRVCLINTCCVLNDAIGNNMRDKLRFFEQQGYHVHTLVEWFDTTLPLADQALMSEITLHEFMAGGTSPDTRFAINHFNTSDLYIFDYPLSYPLLDIIQVVRRGTVIFDYHGVTPPELWHDPRTRHLMVDGQKRISMVQYADYAVGHSRFTANELIATGLIAADRVSVMPYAVPLNDFQPATRDPEIVAQYGLQDALVLLYVGRMAGNKRIIDMVEALAQVRTTLPNTVLLLVGDHENPLYATIVAEARQRAAELGCAQHVIFTGGIAHTELHRFYNTADVYVTTSLHEGFCVPVIEAMSCAKPVVGTAATALPDTIGPGGMTFEPGNLKDLGRKLQRLLTDVAALRRHAAAPLEPAEPLMSSVSKEV